MCVCVCVRRNQDAEEDDEDVLMERPDAPAGAADGDNVSMASVCSTNTAVSLAASVGSSYSQLQTDELIDRLKGATPGASWPQMSEAVTARAKQINLFAIDIIPLAICSQSQN